MSIMNFHDACRREGVASEVILAVAARADNNFELLFALPSDAGITHTRDSLTERPMRLPTLLGLLKTHCRELSLHRRVKLKAALEGYTRMSDGALRALNRPNGLSIPNVVRSTEDALPGIDHWILRKSRGSKAGIELSIDDVLVTEHTFKELLRTHFGNWQPNSPWLSKNVQLAFSAATLFWGSHSVVWSDEMTHPTDKKIKEWLKAMGASNSAQELICKLIRPEVAPDRGGRPPK